VTTINVTRVDHVSYTVADIDASIAFWERFGFAPVNRYQASGRELDVAVETNEADMDIQLLRRPDGYTLELIRYTLQPTERAARNSEVGAAHIGFVVDDIERAYATLAAAGVRFLSAPNIDAYGERWVYLRGPDEITVELMQPGESSQRAVAPWQRTEELG
jgi:catechol 2,3-dioxygenase-like lactoylglutathione lyase family enzyme